MRKTSIETLGSYSQPENCPCKINALTQQKAVSWVHSYATLIRCQHRWSKKGFLPNTRAQDHAPYTWEQEEKAESFPINPQTETISETHIINWTTETQHPTHDVEFDIRDTFFRKRQKHRTTEAQHPTHDVESDICDAFFRKRQHVQRFLAAAGAKNSLETHRQFFNRCSRGRNWENFHGPESMLSSLHHFSAFSQVNFAPVKHPFPGHTVQYWHSVPLTLTFTTVKALKFDSWNQTNGAKKAEESSAL